LKSLRVNFAKSFPINLDALLSRRLLAYIDDFWVDTSISVWVFSSFLWYEHGYTSGGNKLFSRYDSVERFRDLCVISFSCKDVLARAGFS
jgi:hypothetical protein